MGLSGVPPHWGLRRPWAHFSHWGERGHTRLLFGINKSLFTLITFSLASSSLKHSLIYPYPIHLSPQQACTIHHPTNYSLSIHHHFIHQPASHSCIHSSVHWPAVHSFTNLSFIPPSIHWFIDPLIHLLLICHSSIIHPLSSIFYLPTPSSNMSPMHLFINLLLPMHPFIHPSSFQLYIHSFTHLATIYLFYIHPPFIHHPVNHPATNIYPFTIHLT